MKNLNKFINIICLSAVIVLCTGCQKEPDSQIDPDSSIPENAVQTEPELITDPGADSGSGAESETPTPTNAPFPESDMNAVNFNDGNHTFVKIPDAGAAGELSVENVDGNFMLKFTDLSTNSGNLKESVQEIQVSVGQLLNPDQLESVRKISFDFYAEAKEDLYQNEAGESLKVPGSISINGTTFCADETAYEFEGVSAVDVNPYNLERSDVCHVEFEFLLAESGKCWDSSITTEKLYFTIQRTGMENVSDVYLDNLVFYDAEGNSIPLHIRAENVTETTQE
ncbi:MAG: hypothetical protein K2H82_05815 [Oscillospiraceae bacterium]|nr:hypothetical protein [Oscillospiraceae bacterium]